MNNNLKIVLFAVAGLAAGIGLGLLLAPEAGSETRRKLKYASGKLKKRFGIDSEDFSDSELEMDATYGNTFGV
jgi:gas vesicle protein